MIVNVVFFLLSCFVQNFNVDTIWCMTRAVLPAPQLVKSPQLHQNVWIHVLKPVCVQKVYFLKETAVSSLLNVDAF